MELLRPWKLINIDPDESSDCPAKATRVIVGKEDSTTLNKSVFVLLVSSLIALGVFRIYLTYDVFWQTWDEPDHVASGMEWLDRGRYEYDIIHPPLSRIAAAAALYFDGVRSAHKANMWEEGNAILFSNNRYERNLTLARAGILPFFVLASLGVALWARSYGGTLTAVLSVLLFTTLPSILGHSGVATTDMGAAATGVLSLFVLDRWLNDPNWFRSVLLGVAIGVACLAKFTLIGFFALCAVLILVVYGLEYNRNHSGLDKRIACALMVAFLVIWAGYRFSVHWIDPANRPHMTVDRITGAGLFHDITYYVLENTPIPAPEFVLGILGFINRNNVGDTVYLLGQIRDHGYWYFFPLVSLFKTPLAFLALSFLGSFLVFKRAFTGKKELRLLIPVLCVIAVLGLASQAQLNNGTRQVLVVYPLLAIIAGYGASQLLSFQGRLRHVGVALLLGGMLWHLTSSISAHPDYIAYFNELAGNNPAEIVNDSDLDWGQDLKRLATATQRRGIHTLAIKYFGTAPLDNPQLRLPSIRQLEPYQRTAGWVAISLNRLKVGTWVPPYDQYSWLSKYRPVEKIGKSIWLYNIPGQ